MDEVDMEVPPALVDNGRVPMRSTGRMASGRRVREKSPVQNKGKEAKRTMAGRSLPIRERMASPQDNDDDEDGADLENLREEQSRMDDNTDAGEDDARILEGAPRLQEAIRQDALQRAISRDIVRRSRFTPINRVPSRQSTPSSDEDSDSDEYRPPSSPSAASCCSSFSSLEPSPLDEEDVAPPLTTVTRPASSPNPQLPTPPPTASSSSPPASPSNPQPPTPQSTASSSSSSAPRPRYDKSRHTTEDRYATGPPRQTLQVPPHGPHRPRRLDRIQGRLKGQPGH
ncbi:uncharacterized protein TrAtP1_008205 [Trichoderma atroviride]|uniref:uncharacterized protein n=1 Tax=Hypocrea atroviridis TaxID=63577 RepID=UPI00332F8D45|nr:hypothetical protein TrAtP1_008205 [Trichoderma atroviride]